MVPSDPVHRKHDRQLALIHKSSGASQLACCREGPVQRMERYGIHSKQLSFRVVSWLSGFWLIHAMAFEREVLAAR